MRLAWEATNPEMTPTQIMRRVEDHATPCLQLSRQVSIPWPRSRPPSQQGPSEGPGLFEIDNRDRRPPHRRRCRIPASHLGGASVRSSRRHEKYTMAETGSTRVRRRINILFASISTQGRTACSALTTTAAPTPPLVYSHSRSTVHSVYSTTAKTGCEKVLCRASADRGKPEAPPPNSPLLRSIPSQAGTLLLHYRLTVRAHAVRCRLVWPDRGRSNPPPLWTAQSPLTRGKKRRKRRASTRNVREGSMAKWGCHVVDWKPRSAVSSRFFFSFLPANTLFYSARYCGAWHAWPRPSASWLGAGNLAVGTVPHLTWQSSRPCSRAVRCLCSCC